jgi:hypothetical protein
MKQKFQINRRESDRKFEGEIFTLTMKPPYFLIRKCQKLNQFASSWTLALETTFDESHQQQIVT